MHKLILFAISFFLITCSPEKNSEYLPAATGKAGDLIVIMDSVQWKGELGKELRALLSAEVPGLPREEPLFNVIHVHPSKKIRLLTQIRNLMYVFTLDQKTSGTKIIKENFSQETLNKIQGDTSFYLFASENEYARGQKILYLFGNTKESLTDHINQNPQRIVDYFNDAERERLEQSLSRTKTTKGLTDFLTKEHGVSIKLPIGFKLADKKEDFIWLRSVEPEVDKDVWITWKQYESEYQLLPDSIMAWRDSIAQKYIYENPENTSSYIVIERDIPFKPVIARQVSFNDHFAMEIRGLWRTNNKTMGGPFLGYAMVDEAKGRLYYIEGFSYSPGKEQREIMREINAILHTFKLSTAVSKK